MRKAVLFDLFGTLVRSQDYASPYSGIIVALCDTDAERARAFELILRTSVASTSELVSLLEREFGDARGRAMPRRAVPPDVVSAADRELDDHLRSYRMAPGAEDLLKKLKREGLRIACVSNISSAYKRVFEKHNLGRYMDVEIFSCDVGLIKPEREIFELAMSRLGVQARDAIMVGDNEVDDVEGAEALGIRSVLVGDTDGWIRSVLKLTGVGGSA